MKKYRIVSHENHEHIFTCFKDIKKISSMYQYIGFPVPIVKVLRMNIVSVGLCPKVRVIEIVA